MTGFPSADDFPGFPESEPVQPVRLAPRKGRGAVTNMQGRYETDQREAFDDGWGQPDGPDRPDRGGSDSGNGNEPPPALRTQVVPEKAKSILTRNQSPDIPFNVSLNPYRGCEHGCIYCFARPTHSYLGLSPGLDFESRICAKVNAPALLERELARPAWQPEPIALGVSTDAWQPAERAWRITRGVIEVLHARGHPFAAITKSSLIERDLDLLAPMAQRRQFIAAVTITTLDADLARTLEPRAATPARRLRTIRTLVDAGIPVAVSIAPVIPFVTEPDIERVLDACAQAGATSASYIALRLPWEVAPLFRQWLAAHFPERARRVMARVQDMRGGKDYDAAFARRMTGSGPWAEMMRQRFQHALRRLGLNRRSEGILDMSYFHRQRAAAQSAQMALAGWTAPEAGKGRAGRTIRTARAAQPTTQTASATRTAQAAQPPRTTQPAPNSPQPDLFGPDEGQTIVAHSGAAR